ncbi:hypothetical protein D9M72_617260 [compost metagenome]
MGRLGLAIGQPLRKKCREHPVIPISWVATSFPAEKETACLYLSEYFTAVGSAGDRVAQIGVEFSKQGCPEEKILDISWLSS